MSFSLCRNAGELILYTINFTNRMKRDVKLMKKRGKDIGKLAGFCCIAL
ncbi:MAG: type II toxin-antitoxin system YafQ family toxin [Spirochaetia bacterium]|nr:type II toxin-antitoxin system YafQ family toxin [Spirochaetia bacterium]